MKILPFNFENLDNDKVIISNLAGYSLVISKDNLQSMVKEELNDNIVLKNTLKEKLFISDHSELTQMMIASGLGKKLSAEMRFSPIFMIVPTLRCDHTCRYCQVSRASITTKNADLAEEKIPTIISLIKKLSAAPYKIEIQGGEPLLHFDLIERIYHEASSQLGKNNIEFIITSSLSLLTDDMINWSKDKPVLFSVSLDGTAIVHNKNRILPTKDSYERVISNIKKLQNQLGKNRVSTVTTVTKALLKQPESLLEAHKEISIYDLFIRPISPYGFAERQNDYSIEEYLCFYQKLLSLIMDYNRKDIPFVEHSAAIHIKRLHNPSFCGYADLKSPSGLVFNSLLFNYDGKLYGSDESRMLQKVYPDIDFSIGDIDGFSFSQNSIYHQLLSESFNMLHVGCEQCAFQPYCGVDPCQNISLFGEPVGNKAQSRFCQYHKGMFKLLVSKMHEETDESRILKRWSHA
ncbi:His-Xaa-Ser system radical SAM maturase HxsB [Providencia alcalifaciens]|uniref:His-Xaa-Ser system radical SAM maturase HxsB n=1 Tax=Providencia alcalifaciens TaxID=126385 RepID=UPI0015EC8C5D|nr:His-Xaa-Ser system radical SAM maturase HxsB [Providencia alcalifaciens]QLQ98765.1 His-Xaa-Ser system radical SAM maturase HxsB [Providencia alcalifaciens]